MIRRPAVACARQLDPRAAAGALLTTRPFEPAFGGGPFGFGARMKPLRFACLAAAALCLLPLSASASTITLRFSGVADLSAFGAFSTSVFAGAVRWDETSEPAVFGGDWARYLVDGGPASVAASFSIGSDDYSARIEPFSRFEQLPDGLFLQLFFLPAIDLDTGPAPDVHMVWLDIWTSAPPVFTDFEFLPTDLSFLAALEHRSFAFSGADVLVVADALSVPEPTLMALLLLGLAVIGPARVRKGHPSR